MDGADGGIIAGDDDPFAIGGHQRALDLIATIVIGHHGDRFPDLDAQGISLVVEFRTQRRGGLSDGQRRWTVHLRGSAVTKGLDHRAPSGNMGHVRRQLGNDVRQVPGQEPDIHIG